MPSAIVSSGELEDLGAEDLKGIVGQRAWAVLRPSYVESRFDAFHASGLTELVGREEELEILLRRWSKAKSRSSLRAHRESGLPLWLSDTLCRLTSGGAFSTRRLFTDQDEILFAAARPIILNGIEEVITRPDLADRAILLMLAPIAERQRRPETALWREFELARPYILGALLDAAAHGLRMLPHIRLKRLPRMADFALWATACESAFRPAGTLKTAYSNNRRDAIENIVDADPVAAHLRELMADRAQWTGSASDLLQVGINVGGNALAAWTRSGWPTILAHSLAGCDGHRPRFAHSGLRSSSAARVGWERGQSG